MYQRFLFLVLGAMVLWSLVGVAGCDCGKPPSQEGETQADAGKDGSVDVPPDSLPDELPDLRCPVNCTSDAECQVPACGVMRSCVNGVCTMPTECPAQCSSNADCQVPACGSKVSCNNGLCVEPKECPAQCSSDADCQIPACGSRNSCVGGVCTAGEKCPAQCSSDADCQIPACGSRNRCIGGLCVELPTECPAQCSSNADCQVPACKERKYCLNGRCVGQPGECPARCNSDSDCQVPACGPRNRCVGGRCDATPPVCPRFCRSDAECQIPACGPRNSCVNGSCTEPQPCPEKCVQDSDCQLPSCGSRTRCVGGKCSSAPKNRKPVANAGINQKVPVGTRVVLDGTRSSDPDGDPLKFSWKFSSRPPGSKVALDDPSSKTPAFVPDVEGKYELELVVNDGQLDSVPAMVVIEASKTTLPPVLTAISPAKAEVGTTVQLAVFGSGFVQGSAVYFDGKAISTKYVNGTELMATPPSGLSLGSYAVQVKNPDGQMSGKVTFQVVPRAADPPQLLRLDPVEVKAGQAFALTAHGDKFVTGAQLVVQSKSYAATFVSSKQLKANMPALAAGTYTAQVKNPDGQLSNSLTFRVVTVPTGPLLYSMSPTSIYAKQPATLTLSGARFVSGAKVRIGTTLYQATFASATSLKVTVTLNTQGSYPVEVVNPDGQTSNRVTLQVLPPLPAPLLIRINPSQIQEGSGVTVSVVGSNFVQGARVQLSAKDYPTSFVSATELRVTLPASIKPGTYAVVAINPDGQKSNSLSFKVVAKPPAPVLSAIQPNRIPAGIAASLRLTGANFVKGAQLEVGGRLYATSFGSATELKVILPKTLKAGKYNVVVFNPDGQKSNSLPLEVFRYPPPKLSKISPNSGVTGTVLTINLTGSDFLKGAAGLFQGGSQNTTFQSATALQMTLSLIGVSQGSYTIWVQNPDGQISQKLAFKVTAPAGPQLLRVLPNSGTINTTVQATLDGSGFVKGAVLQFGSSKTFKTTFITASTLGVSLDLKGISPSAYPLTVKNPDGKVSNAVYFTVSKASLPAPVLDAVNPTSISLSKTKVIYLTGKHFQNGALMMMQVPFAGSIGLPTNYINSTTLVMSAQLPRIPFPFPTQNVNVWVQNPDKKNSNRKRVKVSP